MDHRLTMQIYQSTSNTFELSGEISLVTGTVCSRNKTLQDRTDLHLYAP